MRHSSPYSEGYIIFSTFCESALLITCLANDEPAGMQEEVDERSDSKLIVSKIILRLGFVCTRYLYPANEIKNHKDCMAAILGRMHFMDAKMQSSLTVVIFPTSADISDLKLVIAEIGTLADSEVMSSTLRKLSRRGHDWKHLCLRWYINYLFRGLPSDFRGQTRWSKAGKS